VKFTTADKIDSITKIAKT